jgi:eukaryotic-like serine/threonine-protein kinase
MGESPIFISATDEDLPRDVPQGLKRYTGFREMAKGGNGMLRSAQDRVTGRNVAIKTLLPEHRYDRAQRRRFLREARITAQLQHPNTVPVYDIGDDIEEGLYFTMKRISGENLFQALVRIAHGDQAAAAAFPLSRRIDIVVGACQALAYAHVRGVIHRDVKPENVWVGNFGEVILLDWGVAKVWGHADDNVPLVQDASPGSDVYKRETPFIREETLAIAAKETAPLNTQLRTLTGGGTRPGTPMYMSPEQIDGHRTIDERSDIFSAGVCLYEAMVIREPFRGQTIDETFDNIKNGKIDPPSVRNPDAGVTPRLDDVVMKALEKKPSNRFQSMRDLIAAILACGF